MPSATELPPDLSNPHYSPPKASFSLPSNPKIVILMALSVLILVLLLLNLFLSSSRRIPANIKPTPTTSPGWSADKADNTPAPILPANIPTQFQDLFNQIEKLLPPEPDFLPPSLDPQISQ